LLEALFVKFAEMKKTLFVVDEGGYIDWRTEMTGASRRVTVKKRRKQDVTSEERRKEVGGARQKVVKNGSKVNGFVVSL
jgi:hypothetical protein